MKRVSVRASRTIYSTLTTVGVRQNAGKNAVFGNSVVFRFPSSNGRQLVCSFKWSLRNTKKCKCTYCLTLKRLKSMFYFRKEKYLNGAKQRQNFLDRNKYYIRIQNILQYFSIFNLMYYSRSKCGVKFCYFCSPIRLRLNLYVVYNIIEE